MRATSGDYAGQRHVQQHTLSRTATRGALYLRLNRTFRLRQPLLRGLTDRTGTSYTASERRLKNTSVKPHKLRSLYRHARRCRRQNQATRYLLRPRRPPDLTPQADILTACKFLATPLSPERPRPGTPPAARSPSPLVTIRNTLSLVSTPLRQVTCASDRRVIN